MKASISTAIFLFLALWSFCDCNQAGFTKIGSNGSYGNVKSFYVPNFFRATWQNADAMCKNAGMQLATIEDHNELMKIRNLLKNHQIPLDRWFHIGGVANTGGSTWDWRWYDDNSAIYNGMEWTSGEPNNHNNVQGCLAIGAMDGITYNQIGYADIDCHTKHANERFLCQTYD